MTWEARPWRTGRWPPPGFLGTVAVLALTGLTLVAGTAYEAKDALTDRQRHHLVAYVRSAAFTAMRLPPSRYAFARGRIANAEAYDLLRQAVYNDATLSEMTGTVLWRPLWAAAGVLALGLVLALPSDLRRKRASREGHRLRGREKITPDEFNRRTTCDGLEIRLGAGVRRKW